MRSTQETRDRELPGEPFRVRLLAWYEAHARDLPWRKTRNPYRVWVSEIMLQQTRVAAVIEHYHEFLRRFPTVQSLAAAHEASVLAAWSGLGYYRRARRLHAAATLVAREYGGKFPQTAEGWRELPGIGQYTAAAIASIAFDEPVAVVDGNVDRVLRRLLGMRLTSGQLWCRAEALLDRTRPGDFNQAVMELGATVCTPKAPACVTCPIMAFCATRGEIARLSAPARQKKRNIDYALACGNGSVFLVQRPPNARLMAGMWELPEIEQPANDMTSHFTLRHSITVTDYRVRVWRLPAPAGTDGHWITSDRLNRTALTGLARKILRQAGLIAAVNTAEGQLI
jgi:A/G-specific adenine glycosylase